MTVGIVLLLLGILLSDIPIMIASQRWPTVPGRITARTLLGQKFKEYDGDYYLNIDGYIRYEYTVEGSVYSSTTVNALMAPYYPYETALNYPQGKEILVFYNPRNPTQAVLEPGLILSPEVFGLLSSILILAGVYILGRVFWEIWKGKRKSSRRIQS